MEVPDIGSLSPRWGERTFAYGELKKHLKEVYSLLEAGDPHFNNELADLVMIGAHILESEITLRQRFKKFEEKAKNDIIGE